MYRPLISCRSTAFVRYGALFGVVLVALPLQAQEHLGPEGNVLVRSPYADAAGNYFGRGVTSGDFDGDGIDDLAITENSGDRLRILRGAAWDIGDTGLIVKFLSTTVTMPQHNYALTTGDFDGDGRDDIAVGAANSGFGGQLNAGAVYVMTRALNGTWSVQSEIRPGGAYPGATQAGANFGNSVTAGDFDNDGIDDLAIGMRGQTVSGATDAGAVMVTYGSASGITATGARVFNRNNDGLSFAPRENDYFGWDLAAGDFDGDSVSDLAIGISNATCPDGSSRGGGVVVLNGVNGSGLSNAQSHIWRPGVLGVAGDCASTDGFGTVLAAGRFDFNLQSDLAIGAPGTGDGVVHVLYGSASGLTATGDQRIVAPTLTGVGNTDSRFGGSLETGRLGHACSGLICAGDSLAIGAPTTTVNGVDNAGAVWVIDAPIGGPLNTAVIRPVLPQSPLRIGGPHTNDQFGNDLAIGDLNDDGLADLAIGSYLYDEADAVDAGAVQVIYQSEFLFVDGFE